MRLYTMTNRLYMQYILPGMFRVNAQAGIAGCIKLSTLSSTRCRAWLSTQGEVEASSKRQQHHQEYNHKLVQIIDNNSH